MEIKLKRHIKAVKELKACKELKTKDELRSSLSPRTSSKESFSSRENASAKPSIMGETSLHQANEKTVVCLKMPTLLGVESACKQELLDLNFTKEQIKVNDGMVTLTVACEELPRTVALLNLSLRTAERVLINLTSFACADFTTLFTSLEQFAFERYLDAGFFIDVVGYSRDSKLTSVPALQRLIKKAIIKRLATFSARRAELYVSGVWQEDAKLGNNRLQFSLVKDFFSLDLDTSGLPLYKRGYRPLNHPAPIRETLAASILYYAHFLANCLNFSECLFDPVCGSGTFVIEAALLLSNTAPGLKRQFAAENMQLVGKAIFAELRQTLKAKSLLGNEAEKAKLRGCLFASDIDPQAIKQARKNAASAEVLDLITFKVADLTAYAKNATLPFTELMTAERVLILANPPYGERLGTEKEVKSLHAAFSKLCFTNKDDERFQAKNTSSERGRYAATKRRVSMPLKLRLKPKYRFSLISSWPGLEKELSCMADKRRKLYNGMLACTLYQYFRHE